MAYTELHVRIAQAMLDFPAYDEPIFKVTLDDLVSAITDPETKFTLKDLGLDSLDIVELILVIEDEVFGQNINDEAFDGTFPPSGVESPTVYDFVTALVKAKDA